MMVQTTLSEFADSGFCGTIRSFSNGTTTEKASHEKLPANNSLSEGGASLTSGKKVSPPFLPALCTDSAFAYAIRRICRMPIDSYLTIAGLLKGIQILNSKGVVSNRLNGSIARRLWAAGWLEPAGITTQDQEKRNYGLATKWKVVKNE